MPPDLVARPVAPRPKLLKRHKNQCFFDALIPCAQNTSKTNAFWTQCYKTTVKLMVFALPPDQCCSNAIKTNAFLMQGPKNTVKLMVSATLVGGQHKKHSKTNGFLIKITQTQQKPMFSLFRVPRRQGVIFITFERLWSGAHGARRGIRGRQFADQATSLFERVRTPIGKPNWGKKHWFCLLFDAWAFF